jgi:hypothetical protein
VSGEMNMIPVSKDVFLSHLYVKTNILPRQARDQHREGKNSKKGPFFLRPSSSRSGTLLTRSVRRTKNPLSLAVIHFSGAISFI